MRSLDLGREPVRLLFESAAGITGRKALMQILREEAAQPEALVLRGMHELVQEQTAPAGEIRANENTVAESHPDRRRRSYAETRRERHQDRIQPRRNGFDDGYAHTLGMRHTDAPRVSCLVWTQR